MTDALLPRGIREASRALNGILIEGETILAAVEGQRAGPGKVWLASLGVGALLVQVSPIESLFSKIVALAMVAIAAYMIGYAVGHYAPTSERRGFGFTLAFTGRGLYVISQPIFGPPTDVEGPIPRSEFTVAASRRLLSYLVTMSGSVQLRLRVASGGQLSRFLDLIEPVG